MTRSATKLCSQPANQKNEDETHYHKLFLKKNARNFFILSAVQMRVKASVSHIKGPPLVMEPKRPLSLPSSFRLPAKNSSAHSISLLINTRWREQWRKKQRGTYKYSYTL